MSAGFCVPGIFVISTLPECTASLMKKLAACRWRSLPGPRRTALCHAALASVTTVTFPTSSRNSSH
eukprot:4843607-Amphidinium_carterae.1